jgi:hypothetical protein
MDTEALVEAVNTAQDAFDTAFANTKATTDALRTANDTLVAAKQALHDDLAQNGMYGHLDTSVSPPTLTLYTAADPDSFTATPIRTNAA